MVDFKFCSIQVSLHREPPEIELVKMLTGSLYSHTTLFPNMLGAHTTQDFLKLIHLPITLYQVNVGWSVLLDEIISYVSPSVEGSWRLQ